ncbi:MAG: hypothetical protein ACRD12_13325 [Acidimicrobiales bacterium]
MARRRCEPVKPAREPARRAPADPSVVYTEHLLDRYEYERIATAVREVQAPEREIGHSLGIG